MSKNHLFNILLALFIVITIPSLLALGESRVDVYVSLFTLEYFILVSVLRPRRITGKDYLGIALFMIFIVIVAYRVMQVLSS